MIKQNPKYEMKWKYKCSIETYIEKTDWLEYFDNLISKVMYIQ